MVCDGGNCQWTVIGSVDPVKKFQVVSTATEKAHVALLLCHSLVI